MKLAFSAAFFVGFAASVSAQGIEPVTTTDTDLDVTVGTQQSFDPVLLAVGAAALVVIGLSGTSSSDGTN